MSKYEEALASNKGKGAYGYVDTIVRSWDQKVTNNVTEWVLVLIQCCRWADCDPKDCEIRPERKKRIAECEKRIPQPAIS